MARGNRKREPSLPARVIAHMAAPYIHALCIPASLQAVARCSDAAKRSAINNTAGGTDAAAGGRQSQGAAHRCRGSRRRTRAAAERRQRSAAAAAKNAGRPRGACAWCVGAGIRALALGEGAGDWAGWITEGDSEQGTGAGVSGYVPSALTAQPWESGGPGTCPGHVWGRADAPVPRPLRACPGFRGLSRPQRRVHGPRASRDDAARGGGGAVAAEDRRVRTPYAGSASGVE